MGGRSADGFDCSVPAAGGGPGGSIIPTLPARRGWRVTMPGKSRHPCFQIGESLLPANIPIFEALGALESLRGLGRLKLRADLPRDEFDAAGGTLRVDAGGAKSTLRVRYLIDASGRDSFLGKQWKLVARNDAHQSAAMFAHDTRVDYNPDDASGNIISANRFAHGRAWFIPLPDGTTRIGCVCKPGYLKARQGAGNDDFMAGTLATVPGATKRMATAKRVSPVRFTGNVSYACRQMAGPRWILTGDAWALLDPVFSSGVFLSMYSARRALDVVDGALRGPHREAALQGNYASHLRCGHARFAWSIYRFNPPAMQALFANPRNVMQLEQGARSMLAGDVFDDRRVLAKLCIFKTPYALFSLLNLRRWTADRVDRRRRNRMRAAADASAE